MPCIIRLVHVLCIYWTDLTLFRFYYMNDAHLFENYSTNTEYSIYESNPILKFWFSFVHSKHTIKYTFFFWTVCQYKQIPHLSLFYFLYVGSIENLWITTWCPFKTFFLPNKLFKEKVVKLIIEVFQMLISISDGKLAIITNFRISFVASLYVFGVVMHTLITFYLIGWWNLRISLLFYVNYIKMNITDFQKDII